jgi:murein DD-endopeptidase MepM/ murein hydrolase activator NlpD
MGALLVRLDALGTNLAYSTSLRGEGFDHGRAIAVDGMGSAYVAGMAESQRLQTGHASRLWDAFASKMVVGTPFLDLPVSYSNFALAALGNVGDRGPGRVNSWFDHRTPNHVRNRILTRWDGVELTFTGSHLPRIGESWYDGHGGIDFRWDVLDETIYAAAPGKVVDTVDNCRLGNQNCGNGFGNRVWIDHGNGYATVYAHLKSVQVTKDTLIADPAAQPLGVMGNTGRSFGTHLHFALYFDRDGDGRWTSDEVVDPYGWLGAGSDPWHGHSGYLWKQPLSVQRIVDGSENGASASGDWVLSSPSGLVTVTIPSEAFTSTALVQLWDMPPAIEPSEEWRATGRSFLLVAERLDAAPDLDTPLLLQPMTLNMAFRMEDMVHLSLDALTLERWDDRTDQWKPVQTEVDRASGQVVAQTASVGRFDLHAPLACPEDSPEPDDHYGAAQTIRADGSVLRRVFDTKEDVDWIRFETADKGLYLVEARPVTDGVRPEVRLYDPDSIRQLASGKGDPPALQWRASEDGVWLLRISQAAGSKHGCDAVYEISVSELIAAQSVAIRGPDAGTVETGYTFTATVSPTVASLPLTYVWKVAGGPAETHSGTLSNTLSFAWEAPKTYQIRVEASNAAGTVTATHSIVVHPPVAASFDVSTRSGQAPLEVSFINTSQGDYDQVRWEFGDGTTSKLKNPTHTYKASGVYTVTLRLSGPGGSDEVTRDRYITVEALPLRGDHQIYLPLVVNHR